MRTITVPASSVENARNRQQYSKMNHARELIMKSARRTIILFPLLLIAWSSWVCKDSVTDGNIGDIVFPDSNVSYSRHVEPLFLRACAITGCHDAESMAAGVSFETYQGATSNPLIIWARDTTSSILVWSLEGKNGKTIMPPTYRPQLTLNQKEGIKRWIWEGAKNN